MKVFTNATESFDADMRKINNPALSRTEFTVKEKGLHKKLQCLYLSVRSNI